MILYKGPLFGERKKPEKIYYGFSFCMFPNSLSKIQKEIKIIV